MNVQQVTAVLTKIQALDNRQVDELTITAWTEMIGDLEYRDALDAVARHFRDSTSYLQPAHVRGLALSIARDRGARGVGTDTSNRALRRCPWSSCQCTHTECTRGWLDREGVRLEGDAEYPVAIRCPQCAKAAGAA
jgi:hypothetical protein